MPKTSVGVGIAAVAFVVGLLVGLLIKGPHTGGGPCDTPQNQHLNVGSGGGVDCEDAKIGPDNTVSWQAPGGSTLRIEFQDPTVFPDLKNTGNTAMSGKPSSNAGSNTYPYNSSVWGPRTPTPGPTAPRATPNARIIIMK